MQPKSRWGTTIEIGRLTKGPTGRPACRWGRPAPHVTPSGSALVESLLKSSRTFPNRFRGKIMLLLLTCRSALTVFWIYPIEIIDSPKLVEFVSLSP
jgi:hypothetical protein